MSVTMAVFLKRSKMPNARTWADAVRAHGFELKMDTDVDVATASGYWPCRYAGLEAGFEFFAEPVAESELEAEVLQRIGDRDLLVSLNTHSSMRDLMTSTIASAVLCAISDGMHWDTEANEFTPAAQALPWGREAEKAIRKEL